MTKSRQTRKSATRRKAARRHASRHKSARPRNREPRTPFADSEWANTDEAARYANLHPDRLRFYARRGMVPAFRLPGEDTRTDKKNDRRNQQFRFRKSDIDAWLTSQRVHVKLAEARPMVPATLTEATR